MNRFLILNFQANEVESRDFAVAICQHLTEEFSAERLGASKVDYRAEISIPRGIDIVAVTSRQLSANSSRMLRETVNGFLAGWQAGRNSRLRKRRKEDEEDKSEDQQNLFDRPSESPVE